jgi:hypothetical protein
MEECIRVLTRWQNEELDKPQRHFAKQSKRLAHLYDVKNDRDVERAASIEKDLKIYMEQEEIKWRKRAKMDWLKHGDRNSKFFHACASQRQKTNKIEQVHDENGEVWEIQEGIGGAFENYFSQLFTAGGTSNYVDCFKGVEVRVSEAMNESLMRPFTTDEVHSALFQMAPLKAPELDGFNAGFFQKH